MTPVNSVGLTPYLFSEVSELLQNHLPFLAFKANMSTSTVNVNKIDLIRLPSDVMSRPYASRIFIFQVNVKRATSAPAFEYPTVLHNTS